MAEVAGGRRYEPDELLRLRDSPLVKKPDGLPPCEEWMGPPQTVRPTVQRIRTEGDAHVVDDGPKSALASARRPSFFESRLSRTAIPEDIVLGPPKMSFASSTARTPGKVDNDPLHSAGLTSPLLDDERGDSPRFERFKFDVLRHPKDKDRAIDREFRGALNKRGGFGNEESEGWTSVPRQPRKSFGAEEGDRFRRDVREKKESPWDRDPRTAKFENLSKDRPRARRDESSWLLDDRRDRDGGRGEHNRFSSRGGGGGEKDPEWMDAGNERQSESKHTMEDFQRWKERMKGKAGSGGAAEKKKAEEPEKKPPSDDSAEEGLEPKANGQGRGNGGVSLDKGWRKRYTEKSWRTTDGEAASPPSVPTTDEPSQPEPPKEPSPKPAPIEEKKEKENENSVDKFFCGWGGSGLTSPDTNDRDAFGMPRTESNPIGKSRFTSFFSSQEPEPQFQHQEPERHFALPGHSPSPANGNNEEDRAGFQHILQMLRSSNGQGSSPISTGPLTAPLPMSRPPPRSGVSPAQSGLSSPPGAAQHFQNVMNRNRNQSQPDPNSEFLLGLIRSGQAGLHQQHQHEQEMRGPPPGMQEHLRQQSQMPPLPHIDTMAPPFIRQTKATSNSVPSLPFEDGPITHYGGRPNHEPNLPMPRGPSMIDRGFPPMDHRSPLDLHNLRAPLEMRGSIDQRSPMERSPMDQRGLPLGWQQQPPPHVSQGPPLQQQTRPMPPPGFQPPSQNHQNNGVPPPPPFLGNGPMRANSQQMPFMAGPGGPGGLGPVRQEFPQQLYMQQQFGLNGHGGLNSPISPMSGMTGPPPPQVGQMAPPINQHGFPPHHSDAGPFMGNPGFMGMQQQHHDLRSPPFAQQRRFL